MGTASVVTFGVQRFADRFACLLGPQLFLVEESQIVLPAELVLAVLVAVVRWLPVIPLV